VSLIKILLVVGAAFALAAAWRLLRGVPPRA
jgi:hypothetical protein